MALAYPRVVIQAAPPGAATLVSPDGTIPLARPTYIWNEVSTATDYRIKVDDASGTVVDLWYEASAVCSSGVCSVRPSTVLANEAHTWYVLARNGEGDGPWSDGMSFTVGTYGSIGAGYAHSLARTRAGELYAWGGNYYGALGDGSTADSLSPIAVSGQTKVIESGGGEHHTVALDEGGSVWSSGLNVYGQLGDGTTTDRLTPVQVSGITSAVAIAAGQNHSLALLSNGTVVAWGSNLYGQLGDGTQTDRSSPVTVSGLTNVVWIAAGANHSLAAKSDGSVWAWGYNYQGQIGDGTQTDRSSPVQVSGLSTAVAVFSGPAANHSLALLSDGTARAWGANDSGQLGDDSVTDRSTPVTVSGLGSVNWIAAGESHSMAVKSDGSAWGGGTIRRGSSETAQPQTS